jgi:hypothetical protein
MTRFGGFFVGVVKAVLREEPGKAGKAVTDGEAVTIVTT